MKKVRCEYENLGHDILGYRCITMRRNPEDKTLAGKRGEIWRYNETHCRAFVVLPTKSEKIITFPNSDLAKWILKLKVPANPDKQADLAKLRCHSSNP